jgi:cobalt-zinc-cadmium efflux system outer membrane protein
VGGSGARSGFDGAETTVQLSQLIERGGKADKRKHAAELEKDLADWDYQSKRLDVLTDTKNAFIAVLGAQENLTLMEQLLDLSERQVSAVTQRVEAGKDMPLEQNKAEVAYSQVRILYRQAQNELQDARRQLAAAWNQREASFERVQGRLEDLGTLPVFETLAQQLSQNPDIARWADEIERSKAQEMIERSNRKRDVTLSAGCSGLMRAMRMPWCSGFRYLWGCLIGIRVISPRRGIRPAGFRSSRKPHKFRSMRLFRRLIRL